jgi:hypothetical protein
MGLTTVIQQTGAFWRYSENVGNQWVLTQKQVGIHPLARCGIQIATFLQLENPNSYTGHCFKRTGGTLMAEGNATPFQIQNRMGKQAVKYIYKKLFYLLFTFLFLLLAKGIETQKLPLDTLLSQTLPG